MFTYLDKEIGTQNLEGLNRYGGVGVGDLDLSFLPTTSIK